MEKQLRPSGNWRDFIFVGIVLLVIFIDQLSKAFIRANLNVGQELFDVGIFRIIHVQNTGAAFGLFSGHPTMLITISFIGVAVILVLIFFLRSRWAFLRSLWVTSALALIVGGTFGNNILDRLRMGHVTDFIDFKLWPVWNFSDMCVTVGVIIVAYRLIFYPNGSKSKS